MTPRIGRRDPGVVHATLLPGYAMPEPDVRALTWPPDLEPHLRGYMTDVPLVAVPLTPGGSEAGSSLDGQRYVIAIGFSAVQPLVALPLVAASAERRIVQ